MKRRDLTKILEKMVLKKLEITAITLFTKQKPKESYKSHDIEK